MKLIVQIPCFNEEMTLPVTLRDIPRSIEGIDKVEILVIDDGSTDKTVEVAKRLGVLHIVKIPRNNGLAKAFSAGLNSCLNLGADIIVNTDADNQYNGADIPRLIKPIIDGTAEIVIGERPIDEIRHFSFLKKKLQRFGSKIVRYVSGVNVPDATSGFRAYCKDAAIRINVFSDYSYVLENIIQAGANNINVSSVKIGVNPKTRESRLFSNLGVYLGKSGSTILRIFLLYKPIKVFLWASGFFVFPGIFLFFRFLYYYFITPDSVQTGHIQSLILAAVLLIVGVQIFIISWIAELIRCNRKLVEENLYRLKKLELGNNNERES